MKILKYIFATVLLSLALSVFAQVEIKKSTEKVRIGDKVYYVHHVKYGETIYSLCRVYNVSQEELVAANPQLSQGLKAEQRIKIPYKTESKSDNTKISNSAKQESRPKKEPETEISQTDTAQKQDSAIKHKIKRGDNLSKIAKKYNCTVEEILKFNPSLNKTSKLKKGQYLTIYPCKGELQQTDIDTVAVETLIEADKVDCGKNLYQSDTLNVVLMLPIKAGEINNLSVKNHRNAYDFVEFYEGFLLSLDSLRNRNISVNLTAFDVYDEQTLKTAFNSPSFGKAQMIICHIPKNLMAMFTNIANELKIPVVLSFQSDMENIAENNKYFIQSITPLSFKIEKLNKILCSVENSIVVIYGEIVDTANFNNFINILKNCGKTVKKYRYKLGGHNENLQKEFDGKTKNNIVIWSNNKVFVSDVLSKLNALSISLKYDMSVYGLPYWHTFEGSLNFDHIHNLNMSMLQSFFVDYNRYEVKNFIRKYRYYYKGDPSRFSFHGYDVGIYFLDKLAKYGQNFMQCIANDEPATLLQTRFWYNISSPQGGLVNTESLLLRRSKNLNIIVE
ncbi:MAG: LysM peptidoglycan-binding domain-containing protein [Prevotellaceae bacterium]|nr:LysM peptidoglycan-binding domain-containing protein [Prevotellaceae bacterium]